MVQAEVGAWDDVVSVEERLASKAVAPRTTHVQRALTSAPFIDAKKAFAMPLQVAHELDSSFRC